MWFFKLITVSLKILNSSVFLHTYIYVCSCVEICICFFTPIRLSLVFVATLRRGNTYTGMLQKASCSQSSHRFPSYLTVHKFQVNSFQCDLKKTSFTSFHILHRKLATQLRACDVLNKEKKKKQTNKQTKISREKERERKKRKQSAKS